MEYKILAKDNRLAVHSTGYFGEQGRIKAQTRVDTGYCARHWMNREQANNGFIVVEVSTNETGVSNGQ